MDNLATARRAQTVVISFTGAVAKGAPLDYLEFELDDVMISSYQLSAGAETPTESISLFFDRLTVKSRLSGAQETVEIDLRTQA